MKLHAANRELFINTSYKNEKAFEKLYRLYFPRLFSFSVKIVEDQSMAKDIVQNTFIKIWESPEVIRIDNPEAYLFKMVKNASLNYIRHLKVLDNLKVKVKEKYLGEELYYIDFIGNEPVELISHEIQDKIDQVMASLPKKCREVFMLSRNEGLKNREIAEKLNMSIKSVEKHISRALTVYRANFTEIFPFFFLFVAIIQLL